MTSEKEGRDKSIREQNTKRKCKKLTFWNEVQETGTTERRKGEGEMKKRMGKR